MLFSAVGSLTASRNRTHGLPFWPALGFGMLYGAAVCLCVALVQGQSFTPPAVASWWLSLLYLALAGSVLTFACFLTLQERIGPGPTGAISVATPLMRADRVDGLRGVSPGRADGRRCGAGVTGNVLMLRRS